MSYLLETPAAQVREKLVHLYDLVRAQNTSETLSNQPVVPREFLRENSISLLRLGPPSGWESLQPPVLFRLFADLNKHPIDYQSRDAFLIPEFVVFDPSQPSSDPITRPTYLTHYIARWADGRQIPRKMPQSAQVNGLLGLRGISPVEFPHLLYKNEDDFDPPIPKGWGASLYEYDPKPNGDLYPHVIMLSHQHHNCKDGFILRGELELILAAMRNRAIQPKGARTDDDDYDIVKNEAALQFPKERNFPVMMISVFPPTHTRVLYACMSDTEVSIRYSSTWSLDRHFPVTLNTCASVLLSSPLDKSQIRSQNIAIRPPPPPRRPPNNENPNRGSPSRQTIKKSDDYEN